MNEDFVDVIYGEESGVDLIGTHGDKCQGV